jgi:cofilin
LIYWCPDSCKINKKFVYSSTKEPIKRALQGIQKDIQASDISELDYDVVRKELLKA